MLFIFITVFISAWLVTLFVSSVASAAYAKSAEAVIALSAQNARVLTNNGAPNGGYFDFDTHTNHESTCAHDPSINMGICIDSKSYPAHFAGFSAHRRVQELSYRPEYMDVVGAFRTECTLSHTSKNEPIVYPDHKDAAHLHHFFGNTAVDENFSNAETTGNSTCQGGTLNRTAYSITNNCYHGNINGSPLGIDCRMNLIGITHLNGDWWRLE